jgi:hypothetical protein
MGRRGGGRRRSWRSRTIDGPRMLKEGDRGGPSPLLIYFPLEHAQTQPAVGPDADLTVSSGRVTHRRERQRRRGKGWARYLITLPHSGSIRPRLCDRTLKTLKADIAAGVSLDHPQEHHHYPLFTSTISQSTTVRYSPERVQRWYLTSHPPSTGRPVSKRNGRSSGWRARKLSVRSSLISSSSSCALGRPSQQQLVTPSLARL